MLLAFQLQSSGITSRLSQVLNHQLAASEHVTHHMSCSRASGNLGRKASLCAATQAEVEAMRATDSQG